MRALLLLVVSCVGLAIASTASPTPQDDEGPKRPFTLKTPDGLGPFIRGTHDTITIVAGHLGTARCSVTVHLESDSGTIVSSHTLSGEESKTFLMDVSRIQYAKSASLRVTYLTIDPFVETGLARRTIQFAWEPTTVSLDTGSLVPVEVGTADSISLLFSIPLGSSSITSARLFIESADSSLLWDLWTKSTLPNSAVIPADVVARLPLGSRAVIETRYVDGALLRRKFELPITPHPMLFTNAEVLIGARTNNVGSLRTPTTPTVPQQTDTLTLFPMPDSATAIVLSERHADGTTRVLDTIRGVQSAFLPPRASIVVPTSNLDIRTTSLVASVYVKNIRAPFDQDLPVVMNYGPVITSVKGANGLPSDLRIRTWNPKNNATSSLSVDPDVILVQQWPVGPVDSVHVSYIAANGQYLGSSVVSNVGQQSTTNVALRSVDVPLSTSQLQLRADVRGLNPGALQWDTTINLLRAYPSVSFQRGAYFTTNGAQQVNDVLTISDIPPNTDSVRCAFFDSSGTVSYSASTASVATAPYAGDVAFGIGSRLLASPIRGTDTVRTLAFFMRSHLPGPYTLLRCPHPGGDVVLTIRDDGTIHAQRGTDSIATSTQVRNGEWHHVAVVFRDNGIALHVDAALQGTITALEWHRGLSQSAPFVLGDSTSRVDSAVRYSEFVGSTSVSSFADLERIQVYGVGEQSAVFRYALYGASVNEANDIEVRDEVSLTRAIVSGASVNRNTDSVRVRFPLFDIGMWRPSSVPQAYRSHSADAYVWYYRNGTVHADTIRGLVRIQSSTLETDSAECFDAVPFDMRVSSSEGWGPFNAFGKVSSSITFQPGYTWADVAATPEIMRGDRYAVQFGLVDMHVGRYADTISRSFSAKEVRDSAATGRPITIVSPRPLRMDRISDSTLFVSVETNVQINGRAADCFDLGVRVGYNAPPPLPISFSQPGPFRQPKIQGAQHLWNTFYAFTEDVVETDVTFSVRDVHDNELFVVRAEKVAKGTWRAQVNMADCIPPLATVLAISYDGSAIKRISAPTHFTITPNRPAWLSNPTNAEWSDPDSTSGLLFASVKVTSGPALRHMFESSLPIIGGACMYVLPTTMNVRLMWDPVSNKLDVIPNESSAKTEYATLAELYPAIDDVMMVANNGLSLGMTAKNVISDAVNLLARKVGTTCSACNPIGTLNFGSSSSHSTGFRLDKHENLEVVTQMSEFANLYYIAPVNVLSKLTQVSSIIESAMEGPWSFVAGASISPTVLAQGKFLIRVNVGSDSEGAWIPQGTLPVRMGDTLGPSLTGAGASLGAGVVLGVALLKGAAGVNVYVTVNADLAMGVAETYNGTKLVPTLLKSAGLSATILIQGNVAWGVYEPTIYGPETFLKTVLAGDDLRDLYPIRNTSTKAVEDVHSVKPPAKHLHNVEALSTIASPSPTIATRNSRSATVWIDQDHTSKVGSLNCRVRDTGKEDSSNIIVVTQNSQSMITPSATFLSDTTLVLAWVETGLHRDSAKGKSLMSIYASNDVHYAIVHTETGERLWKGVLPPAGIADNSLNMHVVDALPRLCRESDSSVIVVWKACDTAGTSVALVSSVVTVGDTVTVADPQTIIATTSVVSDVHMSQMNDVASCTWLASQDNVGEVWQAQFRDNRWQIARKVTPQQLNVRSFDVSDRGDAMVVIGGSTSTEGSFDRTVVLRQGNDGYWDPSLSTYVRAWDGARGTSLARIATRGDSAFVVVRTSAPLAFNIGSAMHELRTAAIDFSSGAMGTGFWTASDSLSVVHDLDISWVNEGIDVVLQEHLPIAGLHANGTILKPLGMRTMNLAEHTIDVQAVITGVEVQREGNRHIPHTMLWITPSPATEQAELHSEAPFTKVAVLSLGGEQLFEGVMQTPTTSYLLNTSQLGGGTYIVMVRDSKGQSTATLLRVAAR